jgi:hypothetical protein
LLIYVSKVQKLVELGQVIEIVPLRQLVKVPNKPEIISVLAQIEVVVPFKTEQFFCDNPIVSESEN